MSAVRLRRLQADFQKLQDFVHRHPRVQLLQMDGDPPERYQLQYQIRSLVQKDDQLLEATNHLVEIVLPRNYPRTPPQCRMLTPIFHPNIAPHAICIGDHWSAGESLFAIVARIGELIAYQSYNTKSPLNGEAARWTSENIERLPLDSVNMFLEVVESAPPVPAPPPPAPSSAAPPRAATPPSAAQPGVFTCPGCGTALRFQAAHRGKRIRCPRCQNVAIVP